MKYNFNKTIFRVWGVVFLIFFCFFLVTSGDYKEYSVTCDFIQCPYNETFFKDKYIIDQKLIINRSNEINFLNDYILYKGEHITFSNYEQKPFFLKHVFEILFYSLSLCFLINHIQYKKRGKNETTKHN